MVSIVEAFANLRNLEYLHPKSRSMAKLHGTGTTAPFRRCPIYFSRYLFTLRPDFDIFFGLKGINGVKIPLNSTASGTHPKGISTSVKHERLEA
jgi:hypothetical protein